MRFCNVIVLPWRFPNFFQSLCLTASQICVHVTQGAETMFASKASQWLSWKRGPSFQNFLVWNSTSNFGNLILFFQIDNFSGLSILYSIWCQCWQVLCLASLNTATLWKGRADSICTILRDAIAGWALEWFQKFCFCHFSAVFCLFPEVCVPRGCWKNYRAWYQRTLWSQWFRRGRLTHSSDSQSWSGRHKTVFKSFSALVCSGWNISLLWWRRGLIVYSLFLNFDALEQGVERKGGNGWEQLLATTT